MVPAPALASPVVLSLPTQPLLSAVSICPVGSLPGTDIAKVSFLFPPTRPALFIPRNSS